MSKFSDNLRHLRTEKGLSQKQVAEHISTSLTQVRRWETAETSPSVDNAALLAKFYKVSLDELCGLQKESELLDVAHLSKQQLQAVKMIVRAFKG